ncbi:hypothetical protein [Marinobacter subterrani]|uniref:hypothetical protein n=1 Tax=Marinobacter subterrani TaxID=1658765 RepID=UPI00235650AD|nr:hypothetical protein [Marinobacter subterrani]
MSRESENTEDQVTQPSQESGRDTTLKTITRGTLKAATKVAGIDVIFKDAKRVRPRHPQLWKDIFNAPTKLRQKGLPDSDRKTTSTRRAATNAFITGLVGLSVVVYSLIMISEIQASENVPLINKIGMVGLMVMGLLQACIYGWITLKLLHRRTLSTNHQTRTTVKPTRSKQQ